MYNYLEAVKNDIKEYVDDEGIEILTVDDLENLIDRLWTVDSVTGNGSGSYTFNRWTSYQNIKDNLPLCIEMCHEFGISAEEFGQKIYDKEYEWLDVSIRCYLLGRAVHSLYRDIQ